MPAVPPPGPPDAAPAGPASGGPSASGPPRAVVARLRAAGCVFAEEEAALLAEAAAQRGVALDRLVARRVAGTPLEQILGWAAFRGLRVAVAPGVFVPRARTAELVDIALPLLRAAPGTPVLVDLCCGSGALGLACAHELAGRVRLVAADIEPAAVACARRNLAPYGARVRAGDLFDALPPALRGRIDVLLANVPYVPTAAVASLPREARDHEPRRALDGGPDGLDLLRRVAAGAREWLAPGGHVLFEAGRHQAAAALDALAAHGLAGRLAGAGEHGTAVVAGALRPSAGVR